MREEKCSYSFDLDYEAKQIKGISKELDDIEEEIEKSHPGFPWSELENDYERSNWLYKETEKGFIPSDGLVFSYDTLNLIMISNLEDKYLMKVMDEALISVNKRSTTNDRAVYHNYLITIIRHYFDDKEYWKSGKLIPAGTEVVMCRRDLTKLLCDAGYEKDEVGDWVSPDPYGTDFLDEMFECCGKEPDGYYQWEPEWIEPKI